MHPTLRPLAAAIITAGITSIFSTPVALGQERVMITSTVAGGGSASGMVSKRSVERWARTLELTEDQKVVALALHEGYQASYQAASKDMNDVMEEARRGFQDSGDPAVFGEKVPAARKTFSSRARALEDTFMEDLKSLLGPSQEEKWPKVERMRRRELASRHSSVSGDGVDLIEVVEGLKLEGAAQEVLAQPLEDYEIEMDRGVQARLRLAEENDSFEPGRTMDMEQMQKRMAAAREAGLKLKDINQRHARKIEAILPEERQAEFAAAVKRQSFPRIYRETNTGKTLSAATQLEDLDSAQRESLAQLKSVYDREIAAANDAWAAVTEREESTGQNGGAIGGPGGTMVMRFGEESEDLKNVRKQRRDVDDRAKAKLASILKPQQMERLPKPEPETQRMVPASGAFVVEGG